MFRWGATKVSPKVFAPQVGRFFREESFCAKLSTLTINPGEDTWSISCPADRAGVSLAILIINEGYEGTRAWSFSGVVSCPPSFVCFYTSGMIHPPDKTCA